MGNNNRDAALKIINDIRVASARHDLITKGDHIVVGLSGGPDSVCLFFALNMLKDELGITISAVHVNHKFRPGAAEEDQKYVEELCASLGVRQISIVRDCNIVAKELGVTSEEAGRLVRYEAFDKEADYIAETTGRLKQQIKIAVAHNAEDQAETLLFRLIRGTGTDGLSGIEVKRQSEGGYTIIRPILGINRAEIENFCEAYELSPRTDHTNLEPIYARNKIRLGLIPYISENFNENITETLNRLATIAGEDKEYLWQQAEIAYTSAMLGEEVASDTEIVLSLEALKDMHKAIRHRVIMRAFDEIGLGRDISQVHMQAADNLIENGTTGKTAEFPYGYKMVTRYDAVAFKAPESNRSECQKTAEGSFEPYELRKSIISLHEWNEIVISKRHEPKNYAAFDLDLLEKSTGGTEIVIRNRKAGDYIKLPSGTKKIQDFLVDSKVPRDKRDSVILVVSGSEVLFIPGKDSGMEEMQLERGRYSSNFSVSATTKRVVLLEVTQKI